MTRWEHCVLEWLPDQCSVTVFGQEKEVHAIDEFEEVFARLGSEGWELAATLGSPTGVHEYWYYFKRPLAR